MQRTKLSDLFNYLLLLFERLLRDQLHLPDPGDASSEIVQAWLPASLGVNPNTAFPYNV